MPRRVLSGLTSLLVLVAVSQPVHGQEPVSEIAKLVSAFMEADQTGPVVTVTEPGQPLSPFGGPSQLGPEAMGPATIEGSIDIVVNGGDDAAFFSSWTGGPAFRPPGIDGGPWTVYDEFLPNDPLPPLDGPAPFGLFVDGSMGDDVMLVGQPPAGPGGPFVVHGGLVAGSIPAACPGTILEFGRGDLISGNPAWEAQSFAPNDIFGGVSQAIVTRCSEGEWQVERLVNQGSFFATEPTGTFGLIFPGGWLSFTPAQELEGTEGHRIFAFTTDAAQAYQPDTVGFTAFPTFPGLAPPSGNILVNAPPDPFELGFEETVLEHDVSTRLGFFNGTCSPETWDSPYAVFLGESMGGPVVVLEQVSTGQLATGTVVVNPDGTSSIELAGSGDGYSETYSWTGPTGLYTYSNSSECSWELSVPEQAVIDIEMVALELSSTPEETSTTTAAPTTTAAVEETTTTVAAQPGEPAAGGIPWGLILVIGGALFAGVGIWLFSQTKKKETGPVTLGPTRTRDDDDDAPRDTPRPTIFGEELDEGGGCDWALYFNDGGTRTLLRPPAAGKHECCVYDLAVETRVVFHDQAAKGRQDAGPERLQIPDYDFWWSDANLDANASARSGPAGRLDWMQGLGDPNDNPAPDGDAVFWQKHTLEEPPEVAAHVGHSEETRVSAGLSPGCPAYENTYTVSSRGEARLHATAECTNDHPGPACPVELTAMGWAAGGAWGDLTFTIAEVAGSDIDELEQTWAGGEGSPLDGERPETMRGVWDSHDHAMRDRLSYDGADTKDTSKSLEQDDLEVNLWSDIEVDAGIIVPVEVWPATERVSAHIEADVDHDLDVSGTMKAIDCTQGCGGHGACTCAPEFSLWIGALGSAIEVDGIRFPIERVPASADRSSPPSAGGFVPWKLS